MSSKTKTKKGKKKSTKATEKKAPAGGYAHVARQVMPLIAFEDMTQMDDMTEETVLQNIKERYEHDLIYTFSTSILVSVNPYKTCNIYSKDIMKSYFHHRLGEQPPHLFAVAEDAYVTMVDNAINISVLVSGESGAGKTECTKVILNYLSCRTGRQSKIEKKLLATVPVLESMGNAKTIRNNNSSRFGKYILIQFGTGGFICGSKINHYLLEKFRLVFQSKDERNFHIFYMMTCGMEKERQQKYFLDSPDKFRYVNQSGCIKVPGIDDKKEFEELQEAMHLFGIDDELQDTMLKILAAILHLGNIAFKDAADGGAAPLDGDASQNALKIASTLLELSEEDLLSGINTKKMPVRNEIMVIALDAEKARSATDALSKALYAKLFDWMVQKLNDATHASKYEQESFFGLLDIFGFEELTINSLEQLLINYANEKLQKFFNAQIFTMEQQEYEREGIDWTKIEFKDNQPCLDLIEKRPVGILSLLDEESRFPKATDMTYLEKINSALDKHENFSKERIVRSHFRVIHYAGEVRYDVRDWLEKNKDEIPDHMIKLLQEASSFKFVNSLFLPTQEELDNIRAEKESGGRKKKNNKMTVGAQFKKQLQDLMDLMWSTTPYFVRCVKPNDEKKSNLFTSERVFDQLRYAGMIETIKIRRMGYPIRYVHLQFFQRYKCVVQGLPLCTDMSDKEKAELITPKMKMKEGLWQMGKTKVFLKQETANMLEDQRKEVRTRAILEVQCWWRMIQLRKHFLLLRRAALFWQSLWRMYILRSRFTKMRNASLSIQCFWRCYKAKKILAKLRKEEEIRKKKEAARLAKMNKKDKEKALKAKAEKESQEKEYIQKLKSGLVEKAASQMAMDAAAGKKPSKKKKKKKKKTRRKKATKKVLPSKFRISLEWTTSAMRRVDMDLSVLQFDRRGNMLDVCFFNNFQTKDVAIKHAGDDRQRQDNKAQEMVVVDTDKMNSSCKTMVILVTTYSDGYTFRYLETMSVQIQDLMTFANLDNQELDVKKKYTERSALIPWVLEKKKDKWYLNPFMAPATGKQYMDALKDIHKLLDFHDLASTPSEGRVRTTKRTYRVIKGQETELNQDLTKITVGLGWLGAVDLDLSCLLFRYRDLVGYVDPDRNRRLKGVHHKGDAKKGSGKKDDEKIVVRLEEVEPHVTAMIFIVNMFKGEGGLKCVEQSYCRIVSQTGRNEKELWRFNLQDVGPRSACMICKVYRAGSKWRFVKMGEPSYGHYYEQMIPKMTPYLDPQPPTRTFQLKFHRQKDLIPDNADDSLSYYMVIHYDLNTYRSEPSQDREKSWRQNFTITGAANSLEINFFSSDTTVVGTKDTRFATMFLPLPEGCAMNRQLLAMTRLATLKKKVSETGSAAGITSQTVAVPYIQVSILEQLDFHDQIKTSTKTLSPRGANDKKKAKSPAVKRASKK